MDKKIKDIVKEYDLEIVSGVAIFCIVVLSFKAGARYARWSDESIATGYFQDVSDPGHTALVVYKRRSSPEVLFRRDNKA